MKKIILISAICAICTQANSQWNLTGNAGTNATTNFIGTTDNIAFKIRTNNVVRMTISNAGKVGIGITSPVGKLHVKGNTNVSQLMIDASTTQSNNNPLIRLRNNAGADLMWIHSDDSSNVFIGKNAGSVNNAAGFGRYNTFMGSNAGYSNTTGEKNTATGYKALYANTEGIANTAIGYLSLYANTTGGGNTAIGFLSLEDNTGTANTATGYYSLDDNTTGYSNTANGSYALSFNTTASQNTAIGVSALYTQSYSNGGTAWVSANTAVGFDALYSNQPISTLFGVDNTAVGHSALRANSRGFSNTATGYAALYTNSTGFSNTAIGQGALYANSTGAYNTACGYSALSNISTGDYNTGVGRNANASVGLLSNSTVIGDDATVNAINKVRIGDVNVTVFETQTGAWQPSDGRFKENVKEDVKGLDFIMKLQPVSYNFNRVKFAQHVRQHITPEKESSMTELSQIRTVGFIAQNVEKIIEQTGFTAFDAVHAPTNETDNYSMGYAAFVVPLVKAVQELSKELNLIKSILSDEQKQKLNEIKTETTGSLEQNFPNPFSSQTEIKFRLPSTFDSAQLIITDANGKQVRATDVQSSGTVSINAAELAAGTYSYLLVIDGVNVVTKQMVLTK